MKIIRSGVPSAGAEDIAPRPNPWKVLVVDDEPDVRRLTTINLRGFDFQGRGLQLIEAGSVSEAKAVLDEHPDIAVALIDVVMETDEAGLKLVEHIRRERNNAIIRLVIRTGQPGMAPERYVIDNYDIDDYRDKTELTVQKLYTTVRLALKGYRDLQTIELNRAGLSRILAVTPDLYNLHRDKLEEYFQGVLMQLIGICKLGHSGMISTIDGVVLTVEGEDIQIRAGAGELAHGVQTDTRRKQITDLCARVVRGESTAEGLRDGAIVVPLRVQREVFGFVYLETAEEISASDRELIQILANQCAAGLDNFRLHHSLEESYEQAIDMLGQVAEFKDSATGTHIIRIQEYTRRLALKLGATPDEAEVYGKASRLHDIGKVGIPDNILRKPGKFEPEERAIMQRHSEIGDTILKRAPSLAIARVIAKSHHERWDGNGYPEGLAGDDIPYVARLVSVVDVFDALLSVRPYKGAWQVDLALDEIRKGTGVSFDPEIAQTFIAMYEAGELDDLIRLGTVVADEIAGLHPAVVAAGA
jgi:response regulator RpfG family c-di-GMP phosphodiesterase